MGIKYRENAPTPRQRPLRVMQCGYAQVLPDYTTSLEVTSPEGTLVARSRSLERGQVRDELHRLKALFPAGEGYQVRAIVTEVKAEA